MTLYDALEHLPFIVLYALTLDLYIPAASSIVTNLGITFDQSKLIIFTLVSVYGAGQIIFGFISELFDSSKILFSCCIVYLFGCIFCGLSSTFSAFLLGCVLQSLGAAGGQIISFNYIKSDYENNKITKIISYIKIGCALSPLVAPLLGAFLVLKTGWKGIYFALSLYGIFIAVFSLNRKPRHFDLFKNLTMNNLKEIFSNKKFIVYSLCAMLSQGCILGYYSFSPFFYITQHHLNEIQFSLIFSLNSFAALLGGIWAAFSINKLGIYKCIRISAQLIIITAILMKSAFALYNHFLAIFVLNLLYSFSAMLMISAALAGVLKEFKAKSHLATAFYCFIETIGSVLFAFLFIGANETAVFCYINLLFATGIIILFSNNFTKSL